MNNLYSKKCLLFGLFAFLILTNCEDQNVQQNTPPNVQSQINDNKQLIEKTGPIPGEYIVVFKEYQERDAREKAVNNLLAQTALEAVNQTLLKYNVKEQDVLSRYGHALRGFVARLSEEQVKELQEDSDIAFVEQNRVFNGLAGFAIPKESKNRSKSMMSQTTPWGVSRVDGHLIDGTGHKAWVIDTGIDLDHSDLNVDVSNSAAFTESTPNDLNGHGTHVAGIIAAKDNSIDVVGVASGATVVAIKSLNKDGLGTIQSVLDGINYVANNASISDVINMSLGVENGSSSIDIAVTNAANSGLDFVVAAGNDEANANNYSPARVNHYNVHTVSAFRQGDEFAQTFDITTPNCNPLNFPDVGSNYGSSTVDYSAPGESILSLWKNNGTLTTCGTSMAAPHIAGILLVNSSTFALDGTVSNDPDGTSDDIMVAKLEPPVLSHSVYNQSPKLTWNSTYGATSYKIYRRFENGSWSLIATTTSNTYIGSLVNPNLQAVTSPPFNYQDTYSYRVLAKNGSGDESRYSDTKYFTVSGCSGPGCGS
ncbi:MAG: S8 family serine peptidase [Balneola sp.]|nr:S8 family serine peptidase [Balneola sp.]MBO6649578.1 S8 family serine peptidase [Balneola sp.]MBO6711395.1 S8 family serine peptidase [Balneola sp.]MBO6801251.1 S8 family serine peptidase [Balneola sp.]MBO6869331.1 S8 family serine peptidase [Balneola sp.]